RYHKNSQEQNQKHSYGCQGPAIMHGTPQFRSTRNYPKSCYILGVALAAPFFLISTETDNMNCSCAKVATAEAQYPRNFPNASLHPGREATMSNPTDRKS